MYPDTVKTRGKIVFRDMQKGIFGYDEKGEAGHRVKALAHSRCAPDSRWPVNPLDPLVKRFDASITCLKKHALALFGNQTE
jgi:hypothetical protein